MVYAESEMKMGMGVRRLRDTVWCMRNARSGSEVELRI